MVERFAKFLIDYHLVGLLLAAGLVLASAPLSSQLALDWRIEGLFPPGDPVVAAYDRLQQRFGGNQIVLAVYRDPGLWDPAGEGLERLEQISRELSQVPGVASVLSLAELHSILEKLRGPLQLLNPNSASSTPLLDPDDRLAQAMLEVFEGYTHQRDSQVASVACILAREQPAPEPDAPAQNTPAQNTPAQNTPAQNTRDRTEERHLGDSSPVARESTLQELRRVMSRLPQPASDGFITGEPVLVSEGFRMVQRDGWRLGIISSVLVSCVLLVCFRSLRWTLIPLAVVHWALITTRALLVVLELDLSLISSTLTALVTVVGVATSIHLVLKFQYFRRLGEDRRRAMQSTLGQLLIPITWACITDATGFVALMAASVGPIRDFGLMMALGSMMVLVAIVLVVPGLALIGPWDANPRTPQADMLVRLGLRRLLGWGLQRRWLGLWLLLALAIWGGLGMAMMQVETDYTKNFAEDSPLVRGYEVIESELGGAGVWDVMLPVPPSIGDEYLSLVLELEDELRQLRVVDGEAELGLAKVLSMADAERASRAGPLLSALPVAARLQGMRAAMPDFSRILLSTAADEPVEQWLRIMLRSRERVSAAAKQALVQQVTHTVEQFTQRADWRALFASPPAAAEITGYSIMLGRLVSSILSDQWKCFLLAAVGILAAMSLATGSLRLGIIAIIPNVLPITLVLGAMGWFGLPVNMGAAMIAAVSLGLSVDSSIHYILHYRRSLQQRFDHRKALQSAQENVGLAVVLSTLALIAGFASLTVSEFIPTVVFGTLASLTMLGGLLGNLLLLPLLLVGSGKSTKPKP